jgi:hypothetical protein
MHTRGAPTGEHGMFVIEPSPRLRSLSAGPVVGNLKLLQPIQPPHAAAETVGAYHSTLGNVQFSLYKRERRFNLDRDAAERHLELAAMFGHATARRLLERRQKTKKKKMSKPNLTII